MRAGSSSSAIDKGMQAPQGYRRAMRLSLHAGPGGKGTTKNEGVSGRLTGVKEGGRARR